MSNSLDPERKRKILIADDHAPFRRAFMSLFPPDEAEFLECSDGYEALVKYADYRPDWVVMDFDMQPMDGLTATENLRKQFPTARVLLITLHDGDDIRVAVRKAGAVAYVRKENLLQARDMIRSIPL